MKENYILIYNYLKTIDKSQSEKIDDNSKKLLQVLPHPNSVTDEEIKAIAVEFNRGYLEYFCNCIDNVSGKKLMHLAKEILQDNEVDYKKLDDAQSVIIPYLSHYKNEDCSKYNDIKYQFNPSFYHELIGVVLDGVYKNCGVMIKKDDGVFSPKGIEIHYNIFDKNANLYEGYELLFIDFNFISHGKWCKGVFTNSDIKIVEIKHFSRFAYLIVELNGEKTTLYIEK